MLVRDLLNETPFQGIDVIPIALQQILREPLNVSDDWQRTEQLLIKAKEAMPGQLEILVALYKMYAYSNRFDESLALINQVLMEAAARGRFNADWRQLDDQSAPWQPAQGVFRLYLYSLKATGFVLLRKGEMAQAHAVLTKLLSLDAQDQVGGQVVYEMAQRLIETD